MSKIMIYEVGGAVRDMLLGREPKDRDFVVVGASVEWMLANGFKQVGNSFPVFLHPTSGDEYALARREKKVAPGYQGFEFEFGPHVSLEDDLLRRDLTINSIARNTFTGEIFDPFGGQHDLAQGIIRHTSEAFAEDPLRVLRVARFAARYNFKVSQDTIDLCIKLVKSGEIDALSADRIWAELAKIFSEAKPSIAFKFLDVIGALETKRLREIVFQPVVTYEDADVEHDLTFNEKVYFQLNLQSMSKKSLEDHRVPLDTLADVKFIDSFYKIFSEVLEATPDNLAGVNRAILDAFNAHREVLKTDRLDRLVKMLTIIKSKFKSEDDFDGFIDNNVRAAFEALFALDFAEMTKGMKNGLEIKKLVDETKMKTVNDVVWQNVIFLE